MREEMNDIFKKEAAAEVSPIKEVTNLAEQVDSAQSTDNGNIMDFIESEEFERKMAAHRYGSGEIKTTYVELLDENGQPVSHVDFDQKVKVRVHFLAIAEKNVSVNVSIFDEKKNNITGCGFRHANVGYKNLVPGDKYVAEYTFSLPLKEGVYSIRINISKPNEQEDAAEFVDVVSDAVVFRVGRWDRSRVWSNVHLFPELTLHQVNKLAL
jgi:lipopolysaccharide transport system ATP-binding protein